MEKMFCTECGQEIQTDDAFCPECGAPVGGNKVIEIAPNHVPQRLEQPFEGNKDYAQNPMQSNTDSFNSGFKQNGFQSKIAANKTVIIAFVAALFIAIGGYVVGSHSASSIVAGSNSDVKAEEMIDDYIRDQGTAEAKYKDKKITITGVVMGKGQFKNSTDYQVILAHKNAGGKTYQISFSVEPNQVNTVNKLDQGDFAVVEGECIGIVKQERPTDVFVQIKAKKINQ